MCETSSHPSFAHAYVHIPFCTVRCGYCDFNTYARSDFGGGVSLSHFDEILVKEIELARIFCSQRPLSTIFFGGGTPSLMKGSQYRRILGALRSHFGFAQGIEITTEMNPESASQELIEDLADAGVTRISIGMQSADHDILHILDRVHTPGQVEQTVRWAQDAGLQTSLDLIYGTPGESVQQWRESIRKALECATDHLSAYALTIEDGTKMGRAVRRGELTPVNPDIQAEYYEIAEEEFSAAGYVWYEISNWARPGFECAHNQAYWRDVPWWGFGPGAHSHIRHSRWWNTKHPLAYAQSIRTAYENYVRDKSGEKNLSQWLESSVVAGSEKLTEKERLEEAIMLGIRIREGYLLPIALQQHPQRVATIAHLIAGEYIEATPAIHEGRIVLTLRGRLQADYVTEKLWELISL